MRVVKSSQGGPKHLNLKDHGLNCNDSLAQNLCQVKMDYLWNCFVNKFLLLVSSLLVTFVLYKAVYWPLLLWAWISGWSVSFLYPCKENLNLQTLTSSLYIHQDHGSGFKRIEAGSGQNTQETAAVVARRMILLSEHSSPSQCHQGRCRGEAFTEKTQEELLLKYCDKLYEALRGYSWVSQEWAIVPTVIKVPWQARIVNVINGKCCLSS